VSTGHVDGQVSANEHECDCVDVTVWRVDVDIETVNAIEREKYGLPVHVEVN
jgi:hypothetical protein